jgi:hypothetical protein
MRKHSMKVYKRRQAIRSRLCYLSQQSRCESTQPEIKELKKQLLDLDRRRKH